MALSNAALRKMEELLDRVGDDDPRRCLVTLSTGERPVLYELLAVGLLRRVPGDRLAFTDTGLRWLSEHGLPGRSAALVASAKE